MCMGIVIEFEVTYGHQEEVGACLLYHIFFPFKISDLLSCFNCKVCQGGQRRQPNERAERSLTVHEATRLHSCCDFC